MTLHLVFEDELEKLFPRHILRFINSVGSKHEKIAIGKAWMEGTESKKMMRVKIKFYSYDENKNTNVPYIYTDYTTFEPGCSSVTIDRED